jgi:hypothetical protein
MRWTTTIRNVTLGLLTRSSHRINLSLTRTRTNILKELKDKCNNKSKLDQPPPLKKCKRSSRNQTLTLTIQGPPVLVVLMALTASSPDKAQSRASPAVLVADHQAQSFVTKLLAPGSSLLPEQLALFSREEALMTSRATPWPTNVSDPTQPPRKRKFRQKNIRRES